MDPRRLPQPVRGSGIISSECGQLLLLTALCLLLFFFGLSSRPIWDIDEGVHASTSKVMVQTGDWITPTVNGENFYDKPALYNWLVAACYLVFGFTEFASRLPSAVLGLATVLVTWSLGRRMFDARTGFLGGCVLATSILFLVLSRFVMHDIALAFFVVVALRSFFAAYQDRDRRNANLLLFYVSVGFAALAKGPLGVVLPGLAVVPFLALRRDLGFLLRMKLHWGIPVFLLVAAPWYVAVSLANPDYAHYFFVQKNFGSFTEGMTHGSRPVYYYVPILVAAFFPWSFFLPPTLLHAFRSRHSARSGAVSFLLWWAAGMFVFFSLASSKLGTYLLPVMPALALLTGHAFSELIDARARRRGLLLGWAALTALLLAGSLVMLVRPIRELRTEAGIDLDRLVGITLPSGAALAVGLALLLRRRVRAAFATLTGVTALALIAMLLLLTPSVNDYRSARTLARRYDRKIPPGEPLVFFQRWMDSALFYTDRKLYVLKNPQFLRNYFSTGERVYCLTHERYLSRLPGWEDYAFLVDRVGPNVVLSNRPDD